MRPSTLTIGFASALLLCAAALGMACSSGGVQPAPEACPDTRPVPGDACDPSLHTDDCSYAPEAECGPGSGAVMVCDQATASWEEVDAQPCVVCDPMAGIHPEEGDECSSPGLICDNPCSGCAYVCGEDHIWHYQCWTCPDERPGPEVPCDPFNDPSFCTYPPIATCGPGSGTTFECSGSAWQEMDAQPCTPAQAPGPAARAPRPAAACLRAPGA